MSVQALVFEASDHSPAPRSLAYKLGWQRAVHHSPMRGEQLTARQTFSCRKDWTVQLERVEQMSCPLRKLFFWRSTIVVLVYLNMCMWYNLEELSSIIPPMVQWPDGPTWHMQSLECFQLLQSSRWNGWKCTGKTKNLAMGTLHLGPGRQ
jgi:hypothetical protein